MGVSFALTWIYSCLPADSPLVFLVLCLQPVMKLLEIIQQRAGVHPNITGYRLQSPGPGLGPSQL